MHVQRLCISASVAEFQDVENQCLWLLDFANVKGYAPLTVIEETASSILLWRAWCVDTEGWCERCYIYNIDSVEKLRYRSFGGESTGELQLLETGAGGESTYAVGTDRIHYARDTDVDFCDAACGGTVARIANRQ